MQIQQSLERLHAGHSKTVKLVPRDHETHSKVEEEGGAFTGSLCPLTSRGAWLSENTRPATTDITCRDHNHCISSDTRGPKSESDQGTDDAVSYYNSNRQRRDRSLSCKDRQRRLTTRSQDGACRIEPENKASAMMGTMQNARRTCWLVAVHERK